MARKDSDAVRITSASQAHSDDISRRQRRYLVSMGIRTVCFVLAVVFAGGVLMWIFIAASFILPYIAVVMANAGASTDPGGPESFTLNQSGHAIEAPPTQ
jgi:hypothetical protein